MRSAKPDSVNTNSMKESLTALAKAANQGKIAAGPETWTLPSGEALLHYALKGGFLAPSILKPEAESAVDGKRNRGKR